MGTIALMAIVEDVSEFTAEELWKAACSQCYKCLEDISVGDSGGKIKIADVLLYERFCSLCWKDVRGQLLDAVVLMHIPDPPSND